MSQMLTTSLTLLTGIVCLYIFGNFMMDGLKRNSVSTYVSINTFEMTEANIYKLSVSLFILVTILLAPLLTAVVAASVFSKVIQDNGQIDVHWERITLDLNKMNPVSGFGKLFNKDALVEMLKSFLKILVISYIVYRVVRDETENIAFLAEADVETLIGYIGHLAFKIVTHSCGILIVLGIFDLMYVKWRYVENLKMTKQEVKDEAREHDLPPEIKSKIKKMQYQMARRRMIAIIPTADVVITNPTHYAVALRYDREKMIAPVVIAKGIDVMAQAIRKIAEEHKVTLVENRFLARELYSQVSENEAIPESLYAAVAEVLAYVYRLKGKI